MSELISGKEALIALANGEDIELHESTYKKDVWFSLNNSKFTPNEILNGKVNNKPYKLIFRRKPKTITINGIEVPASFEPKVGDYVYFLCSDETKGYAETTLEDTPMNWGFVQFGAWRNEEEIIAVVAALRSIFKGE